MCIAERWDVCVFTGQREADVYEGICWESVTTQLTCTKPIADRQTTFTECCCLYGEAWGMDCALCPVKNTGRNINRLHVMKLPRRARLRKNNRGTFGFVHLSLSSLPFTLIQLRMPQCVISVGRMVKTHWSLAQVMSMRSALNMTPDLWTLTAHCPSMKIMAQPDVSVNSLMLILSHSVLLICIMINIYLDNYILINIFARFPPLFSLLLAFILMNHM